MYAVFWSEDGIHACANQYDVGGICFRQTNRLKATCWFQVKTIVELDDKYESTKDVWLSYEHENGPFHLLHMFYMAYQNVRNYLTISIVL